MSPARLVLRGGLAKRSVKTMDADIYEWWSKQISRGDLDGKPRRYLTKIYLEWITEKDEQRMTGKQVGHLYLLRLRRLGLID